MARIAEDLTGQVFDMLTVVEDTGERVSGSVVYLCKCACGNTTTKARPRLLANAEQGLRNHCGCLGWGRGSSPVDSRAGFMKPQYPRKDTWKKSFAHLLGTYQRGASKRGYSWLLTESEFAEITSQNCFYCGSEPASRHTLASNEPYTYNGIDRVDNSRGYESGNVVACCGICNRMKQTLSVSEFLEHIKRIVACMK